MYEQHFFDRIQYVALVEISHLFCQMSSFLFKFGRAINEGLISVFEKKVYRNMNNNWLLSLRKL